MSSDKVSETKESVVDTTKATKEVGGEKAADAKDQFEAANKEAEFQLDAANKSDDPTFAAQAKEKAAKAKEGAASAHEKVTGAVADGWAKTKGTFDNINQYPDKK